MIVFKAKIPGIADENQPTLEIEYLSDLRQQNLIEWSDIFKYVKQACEWTDDQANNIIRTIISSNILKIVGARKTVQTILDGLKQHI